MTDRKRKTAAELAHLEEQLERELGRASTRGASRRGASRRAEHGVAGMADLVRGALIPVEPSQQFVRELGRSLTATAARSRQSLVRRYRMAIVIGAAAFGSLASVVGIAVLIIRQRSRMRTGLSR